MRLVVVCWLLLLSPELAFGSDVRLITERLSLDSSLARTASARLPELRLESLPHASLRLTAPCFACRLAGLLPASELTKQLPAGRAQVARRAKTTPLPARPRVIAIGDSWQLGHGRELSVRLTPTQEECAPLMRLKF